MAPGMDLRANHYLLTIYLWIAVAIAEFAAELNVQFSELLSNHSSAIIV